MSNIIIFNFAMWRNVGIQLNHMANKKKAENKKSSEYLRIRCSPDFKKSVEEWAESQDKSVSEAVRDALLPLVQAT